MLPTSMDITPADTPLIFEGLTNSKLVPITNAESVDHAYGRPGTPLISALSTPKSKG